MSCPYNECSKTLMCDECYIDEKIERRFKIEKKYYND
jgi:hypothetical protein